MKRKAILIFILSSMMYGCSTKENEIDVIERSVSETISNFCPYATAKNFKKINGYKERDYYGNEFQMVEYEYEISIKADKKWKDEFKSRNEKIEKANNEAENLKNEILKIQEKSISHYNKIYEERIKQLPESPHDYMEAVTEMNIRNFLEIHENYVIPSIDMIEEYKKKWGGIYDWDTQITKRNVSFPQDFHFNARSHPETEGKSLSVSVPIHVQPNLNHIPRECIGLGNANKTALDHINKEKFLPLIKKINNPYIDHYEKTIQSGNYFINGEELKIKAKSALRETDNGWALAR